MHTTAPRAPSSSLRLPGLAAVNLLKALRVILLPIWFLIIDIGVKIPQLARDGAPPGLDAMIYIRGAAAYLAGGTPWSASVVANGFAYHFAGLPTDVLLYVPSALVPEGLAVAAWIGLSLASAVWVLRRLRLPIWYVLFPPLLEGVYSANPQIVCLACLVAGVGALAAALKVYAVAPMLGARDWRGLTQAAMVMVALVVVAPRLWLDYAAGFGAISARLNLESLSGFSAYAGPPILFIATAIAVGVVAIDNPRTAGWLVVPALWPASQLHYSTMFLPVITPLAAAALAFPWRGVPALVTIGYALATIGRRTDLFRARPAVVAGIRGRVMGAAHEFSPGEGQR